MLVDVDIANRALARIGESAISAFDEDSDAARQVVAVYDDTIDAAIAFYQWRWCRRTTLLAALAPPVVQFTDGAAAPPVNAAGIFNGWPYAFSFPADALSQPLALYLRWPDDPCRDFAVEGLTIFARQPTLYGTFAMRLSPDQWPPMFRSAVISWLASELAVPITHDKGLAESLWAEALGSPSEQMRGGKIGRAIAMDVATGGPPAAFAGDPVTEARYRGAPGAWYGG